MCLDGFHLWMVSRRNNKNMSVFTEKRSIATARIIVTFAFTGSSRGLGTDVNRLERPKSIKRSPEDKRLLASRTNEYHPLKRNKSSGLTLYTLRLKSGMILHCR